MSLGSFKILRLWCLSSFIAIASVSCGSEANTSSPSSSVHTYPATNNDALVFAESRADSPEGSYIVNFRGEWANVPERFASFFAETRHFYAKLSSHFLSDRRVKSLDFLHHLDLAKALGSHEFAREFGTPGFLQKSLGADRAVPLIGVISKVEFASEVAARAALIEWYEKGLIWFAEPDFRSSNRQDGSFDDYISRYSNLGGCQSAQAPDYWLERIKLLNAYQELSNSGVTPYKTLVAVMDSGIDFSNSHLNKRKWTNQQVGARGCVGDIHGCNTTVGSKGVLGDGAIEPFNLQPDGRCPTGRSGCDSNCCHGTHVAGIIAGYTDEGDLTMGGVCPMCEIVAIRVLGKAPGEEGGTILDSSIIRGFKYLSYFGAAEGFGVRVINASFGKFQRSRAVSLLIRLLRETSNGVLVVGAAGNEDSMKPNYPAGYSDAIAVSNIHASGAKHVSSNFGRWVDISAPGDQICSTVPGGFESKSGTSMAAPVVSGVAGLLLAVNPSLTYAELRNRILLTADPDIYSEVINGAYIPPPPDGTTRIPLLGTGMVDAFSAVKNQETQDLPVVGHSDRVTIACGNIPAETGGLPLWFVVPIIAAAIYRMTCGRINRSKRD